MSENFNKVLANIEILSGCLLFTFSLWLFFLPLEDPHGSANFVAFELGLFSIIVVCCGFTFKMSKYLKIPSQCIFLLATLFIYIDLCTSYTGWYIDL